MSFVLQTLLLTSSGIPIRITLPEFHDTVAFMTMKFAVEWKRQKKGYSSSQRAVFYEDKDVLWWIDQLKEQGIEDYDIFPVMN